MRFVHIRSAVRNHCRRLHAGRVGVLAGVLSLGVGLAPAQTATSQPAVDSLPLMLSIEWHKGPSLPQGFQDNDGGIIDNILVTACGFCAGRSLPGKESKYPRGFINKAWGLDLSHPGSDWMALPAFPGTPRQEVFGVSVQDRLCIWGGLSYSAPYCYRDGYGLSRQGGQWRWEKLPDLPEAVCSAGICTIGGKIYCLGGADYDAEKFYTHADRKGESRGLGAQLRVLDTRQMSIGWKKLLPCPGTPRWVHATAAVDGKVYVFGGVTGNDNKSGTYCTVVDNWQYDPKTGTWERLPDLPVSSGNFASGAIVYADRYILLIGGYQYPQVLGPDGKLRERYGRAHKHYPQREYFSDIFVWDTTTARFGRATPLPLNNNGPMTVVRGDRVHLIGGETELSEIEGEVFGHHPELYLIGTIRLTSGLAD